MSAKARQVRSTSGATPIFNQNEKEVDDRITSKRMNSKYSWTTKWYKMPFVFSVIILLAALTWQFPPSVASRLPYLKLEPSSTLIHYPNLLNAGAEELIVGLKNGSWTSVELTRAYILRIQDVNPTLNAVTELNPDSLSIAAALDVERANGKIRSPLHGIPILIKNNIATQDSMNNTAGCYSLLGAQVSRDSTIAANLRAAGIIILGKSNMSQWANFRSLNSSNGWSSHGGQVTGAYYPNMDPSGSSSGSGVASSLGLAFASLGTETSGSILSPSSRSNIVGIKPTVGLTSRSLVIPVSERQDTIGPMARTVSDAALLLNIIAGKDSSDNYTLAQPFDKPPDYVRALNFSSFRGARIGIVRNALPTPNESNQPILDAFENAIVVMKNAGAILANTTFSSYDDWANDGNSHLLKVAGADFVSGLPNYLSELVHNPNNINNLDDQAKYTHTTPIEEYPQRDTGIWDAVLSSFNNTSPEFWEAYQTTSFWGNEGGVTGALKAGNFDALILPTNYAWFLPAFGGLPVVTVPMGFYPENSPIKKSQPWGLVEVAPNIPFGLSFMGPKWSEELLIGLAYAYERHTSTREQVKPYLVPKTQLSDVVSMRN